MKTVSDYYPEVKFQIWTTPLSGKHFFYLLRILHTNDSTHFFFQPGFPKFADGIYVLTISRFTPFRLIDDSFADASMRKFFRIKDQQKKKRRIKGSYTWKMWGTPFLKDLDQGNALNWWRRTEHSIFSYLIIADDLWIELLGEEVKWNIHRKKTLKQLVNYYWDK